MNRTSIFLPAALFILVGSVNAQTKEKGELHIYSHESQVGVVANREFKDEKGRVVKTIYYYGDADSNGQYREELLKERSIHTVQFDDNDCPIKGQNFDPGMKLTSSSETICFEGTSEDKLITTRDARGIRTAEIRKILKEDGRSSTSSTLFFDATGEKVVALDGDVPTDVDLLRGWGPSMNGFALGIAVNREKGRQEELEVWCSLKNIDHKGDPYVQPWLVELTDSNGRFIEPLKAHAGDVNKPSEECTRTDDWGGPDAGTSALQRGFWFRERYAVLAPGRYSVTIKYCMRDVGKLLASNQIDVEIEAPRK
jgi:hypothetical protein